MLELIRTFYGYNSWATDRLLVILGELSPAQYTVPGCSGQGSIRETLAYLLRVQADSILQYQSAAPNGNAAKIQLVVGDCATVEAARRRWSEVEALTKRFIGSLSEENLRESRRITCPDGMEAELQLGNLLLHVANHGTHTRGQIIAAIRRDGIDPGEIDFLSFLKGAG